MMYYGLIGGIFAYWYYFYYWLPKEYHKLNLPDYKILPLAFKVIIMLLVVTLVIIIYPLIIIEVIYKEYKKKRGTN